MALQQIVGVTHMGSTGGGGGPDSAYLPPGGISLGSAVNNVTLTFYAIGRSASELTTNDGATTHITWKTGPNAASAYEVNFILIGDGNGLSGSGTNAWATLGTSETPSWAVGLGIGNFAEGYLVIRNASNPSVELANCSLSMSADPNT